MANSIRNIARNHPSVSHQDLYDFAKRSESNMYGLYSFNKYTPETCEIDRPIKLMTDFYNHRLKALHERVDELMIQLLCPLKYQVWAGQIIIYGFVDQYDQDEWEYCEIIQFMGTEGFVREKNNDTFIKL